MASIVSKEEYKKAKEIVKKYEQEQLNIPVVDSSKRVKILDQGNGDCGLICDEILEHYEKENYLEKGDLLYSCELIKTY